MDYRKLTAEEITVLKGTGCSSADWSDVLVADGFDPSRVSGSSFSGKIRLGAFRKDFTLPGGVSKPSG